MPVACFTEDFILELWKFVNDILWMIWLWLLNFFMYIDMYHLQYWWGMYKTELEVSTIIYLPNFDILHFSNQHLNII